MSAYMVQENHWKKLNTILFQYAISLYFSWILLDHSVYKYLPVQTHIYMTFYRVIQKDPTKVKRNCILK